MEVDRFRFVLEEIYGSDTGFKVAAAVAERLDQFHKNVRLAPIRPPDHTDSILITYGDQFHQEGEPPLTTLAVFCDEFLQNIISGIHILPFFPYSSDDGFSVIDYSSVDPRLGDWNDVYAIAGKYRLMADLVLNHCSVQSAWFQAFLRDDPHYRNYFIAVSPDRDLSQVVRPRALPLLTPFQVQGVSKHVWTTFSTDQVDLNYANPDVLLEMVDIVLAYLTHGAQMIRLDAIAYLWKEIGTTCIHLPQTHRVVQFLRALLDEAAPGTVLITETNVPHLDNISYFGNGANEAGMVYNFALPPLALHSLHTGDSLALNEWAAGLSLPSAQTTFFNFLASHDGIGLNPVRGLLSDGEIQNMIDRVLWNGGLVSNKNNPDGTQSGYELNVSYLDALANFSQPEDSSLAQSRFMAAQAMMLVLRGVPGIYLHSLIGSRSWNEGVSLTGQNRTINRQKFESADVWPDLRDANSFRGVIYHRFRRMLQARAGCPAFDPYGQQEVLMIHPGAFVVRRESQNHQALCLINLRPELITVPLPYITGRWRDLLTDEYLAGEIPHQYPLQPYQVVWLERK